MAQAARTTAEKIIAAHAGADVSAGAAVRVDVDLVMATDGNAPLAIELLKRELGAEEAEIDGSRIVLVIDHCAPAPNAGAANMQVAMRRFAAACGARIYDAGSGISHVVLPEQGDVLPGMLVLGSDSHTVTYGALNCLGIGMGSTDIAVAMRTGRTWLRVPETIKVWLSGQLQETASAKDAVLALVREIGVDGATYACLEFDGDGLESLSMEERLTFANMSIEMGAKCALMPVDGVCREWLGQRVKEPPAGEWSDPGCSFAAELELDLGAVRPMVARPHDLTEITELDGAEGTPIDIAFIGTCTNGRLSDLRRAAKVLAGRQVAPGVQLIVSPGSRQVLAGALSEGLIESLVAAGALITTPGCGPCVGTHQGVPGDGHTLITTANRNFRGRMGNREASIFVASPEVVARSALAGVVTGAVPTGQASER
ncbi:MAG TPA: aconitase/3-isopropylmalate dehydratase large subunit family protein [Solirubrobacterales bacterium]|nr:aconitase/3-isopropylmalate dehydratase large subunit family protein [Solirubrobacterales bacterium]